MISVVTAWLNSPELVPAYERAVKGAQVIIIDNGSDAATTDALRGMVDRLDGIFIRNENNTGFAAANNQGMAAATGDIIVFLNNDIEAFGDWQGIVEQLKPGGLYSPSMLMQYVNGVPVMYLEGWCLIGHRADFERIGGWAQDWEGLYWEDNELCWRASRAGLRLQQINLPLAHLSNYTTSKTPGAYDRSAANRERFEAMVRGAQ